MPVKFEHLGFHIDYAIGTKFIGSVKVETNDRGSVGYYSKREHIADDDIIIGKKKIKKGTKYNTIIWPLCGRKIKN